ncbi:DNA-processing protein DprA [Thermoflavimicrobium dichotomicum]|uniref:DNA processing protein n=1 Tax=Thermoflavimicrobium dichotomicum TaxID=46223 RepID=A0A1I3PMM3_9BACL|nr:DNA-processing protein DprA [Thermoflavimicrobium dichotomicum]SFJ22743.1 DNA processing protein [Thermoflavimicrobium dichotomicum]
MKIQDGLIALNQIDGIGWHTIHRMLEWGWLPDQEISPELTDYLRMNKTSKNKIEHLQKKWNPHFIRQVVTDLKRRNIIPLTPMDETYPELLKEIAQPPWVLYVKGDIHLLSDHCIAVVGTRKPSAYGIRTTRYLCEEIAQAGWVIVSGMAHGIDAEAHRSALQVQGKTVAILGTGVDVIYPRNHRFLYEELIKKGAVVSEMPPDTQPHPGLFPRRNRIISGLSHGTVVIEAARRSGSLITADYSMEQGREVFAVPGSIMVEQSQGTLRLIQQGAKCITSAQDIFEEFPYILPQEKEKKSSSIESTLNANEHKLLQYISQDPIQMTELIERVAPAMTMGEIHQAILSLQLKQLIVQLPGSYYVRQ